MTLIATAGSSTANSFCTVAEAFTLLGTELDTDAWTEASTIDQERALITATRLIVEQATWQSDPTTDTQALPWPQEDATDRYGRAIADTVVPMDVKRATALYAVALLAQMPEGDLSLLAQLEQLWVGDTKMTFRTPLAESAQLQMPANVRAILAPYVTGRSSIQLRVVRG